MTRVRFILAIGLAAPLAWVGALTASQGTPPAFPHDKHEKLFPVCEGCHAGITSGNDAELYPNPSDCERCHDDTREKRVEWRVPAVRVSNLRFSHAEHRDETARAGEAATCQACHAASGPPSRMNVSGPDPSRCLDCHAHASEVHLSPEAQCRECHVALTQARGIALARVAQLARPAWHDSADFPSTHGSSTEPRAASCAICHARETCERCHANADRVEQIATLEHDPRVATLEEGKPAGYTSPRSHQAGDWARAHGAEAKVSSASCANCHTQPSCTGCHLESTGTSRLLVQSLPGPNVRPGVGVNPARITSSVHAADVAARHGALAAAGSLECTQCHSQQACAACHSAADSRAFHAANFVERHATDVFAGRGECQSCHNTERFCRDCHARTGIASQSGMNSAFHTGQPGWVLSHGQAARTGMEACAACHRQNDCVRCHSAAGGWGVNPHGPGFPAAARAARNAASCRWCHLSIPGGGR